MCKSNSWDAKISLFAICVFVFFVGCTPQQQSKQYQQPQRAVDLYVDAVILANASDKEKAVEKLNASVQQDSEFSLSHSMLGDLYQEIGDYEKSESSYENATRLNNWSFNDYFNLGHVRQITKKYEPATKAYDRACQLKPDHLEANLNNAQCYYEIKNYRNALAYSQQAEKINPDVSEVQKILGDIYETQKDYNQAIVSYKRALEIDSNNPEIITSLAVAYLKTNRNDPAKELLYSAIKLKPDNSTAHQYLGYCYLRLYDQAAKSEDDTEKQNAVGFLQQSIDSYLTAIKIDNRDWEAYRGLGVAYILKSVKENDQYLRAKAVDQWRMSLELNPRQPRSEKLKALIQKYAK